MSAALQPVAPSCPECGAPMALRPSKWGQFWGCTMWRETRCPGSHGAHADGRPLGTPATKETKDARIRAHAAFDTLWREEHVFKTRSRAYRWMAETLHLTKVEAHIGKFTLEQCELLIAAVDELLEAKR